FLLLVPATLLLVSFAAAQPDTKKDVEAIKAYLAKNHPGKKWHEGPLPLDAPAVREAFGKRRFYAVVSNPPLPPGAFLPDLVERFKKQSEDFRKNYITVLVFVDAEGAITPIKTSTDYNAILNKVAGDQDAKTAAAAILTVQPVGGVGKVTVSPDEIQVT